MANDTKCLKQLKKLRKKFTWEIEDERNEFLRQIGLFIKNWKGQLPELQNIFRPEEIDWLLMEAEKNTYQGHLFMDFAMRTGYKDKSNVEKDEQLSPCPAVPAHHVARRAYEATDKFFQRTKMIVSNFFKTYDEYKKVAELLLRNGVDPNLVNSKEFTPLQIICMGDRDDFNLAKKLFKLRNDTYKPEQMNVQDKRGWTPLHEALSRGHKKLFELLLSNGADPNLATDRGSTLLHTICDRDCDDYDLAKMLFELSHKRLQVNTMDHLNQTPIYLALSKGHRKLVKLLLINGADSNAIDKNGFTPLHIVTKKQYSNGFARMIFELSQYKPVKVNVRDRKGNTPLYYALFYRRKNLVQLLLKNGADPNLPYGKGLTPLHMLISKYYGIGFAKEFFEINDVNRRKVIVDARFNKETTPLELVWGCYPDFKNWIELLLTRGADPNLPNEKGLTPLHIICKDVYERHEMVELFFKINDHNHRAVKVNARDPSGNTPLHLILQSKRFKLFNTAELLLKKGANPNLTNNEGLTPLHIICKKNVEELYCGVNDLVELFLKMRHETLQIDAQDEKGRTPLQLAVANLKPDVVDVFLNHGADISSFVFPTESDFKIEEFEKKHYGINFKLRLASGVLPVIELLENRGYELKRSDALIIMKLLLKLRLFEKSEDVKDCWYDDEKFVKEAKEIMINPSLSLNDLTRLQPEEAEKLFTHTDYLKLVRSDNLWKLPKGPRELCTAYLCEIMSRGFIQRWTWDPFLFLE